MGRSSVARVRALVQRDKRRHERRRRVLEFLARCWCKLFHRAAFWPIHDRYLCAVCLREWEFPQAAIGQPVAGRLSPLAPNGGKIGALNLEER